jgi:predicted RNA binding protein YcfA (HicA-like mRNA interferase family)
MTDEIVRKTDGRFEIVRQLDDRWRGTYARRSSANPGLPTGFGVRHMRRSQTVTPRQSTRDAANRLTTSCSISPVFALDWPGHAVQLLAMKVRELLRLLEQDGWPLVRTRGSHRQLRHWIKPGTVTVSGNAGGDVPPATLRAILKQARIQPVRNVNAIRRRD